MAFRTMVVSAMRTFQLIFAIISLSFSVLVLQKINSARGLTDAILTEHPTLRAVADQLIQVPHRIYLIIFVSTWTFFATAYLVLAPRSTKLARLVTFRALIAIEILTTTLWFAAFISSITLALEFLPMCITTEEIPTGLELLKICPMTQLDAFSISLGWLLWTISALFACCTSFKCCSGKRKPADSSPETADSYQPAELACIASPPMPSIPSATANRSSYVMYVPLHYEGPVANEKGGDGVDGGGVVDAKGRLDRKPLPPYFVQMPPAAKFTVPIRLTPSKRQTVGACYVR